MVVILCVNKLDNGGHYTETNLKIYNNFVLYNMYEIMSIHMYVYAIVY